MKIKDVIATLERFAPLPLQDSYDNAGLQIGQTEAEVSGVLLCLDVTEAVVAEAASRGANMIVAHHPLLFRGLKRIAGETMVERVAAEAIRQGITIYAAHTNLDNAPGGVNYMIAGKLGAAVERFLLPREGGGSGVVALLCEPVAAADFLQTVKSVFGVECLMHNAYNGSVQRLGICGGAGGFLLQNAIDAGCDAFLTGEMHYHDYFGHEGEALIAVIGHYQSEKFTVEIFRRIIEADFRQLPVYTTQIDTNPIKYL